MNGRCSVCRHPNRTEIEKALTAHVSLRNLAGQFAVSKDAARRHRTHMAEIPRELVAMSVLARDRTVKRTRWKVAQRRSLDRIRYRNIPEQWKIGTEEPNA